MAWDSRSGGDIFTKWTTPKEEERINAGERVYNPEVYACPICKEEVDYVTKTEIDEHVTECKRSLKENLIREVRESAKSDEIAKLRKEIRAEVMKEIQGDGKKETKPKISSSPRSNPTRKGK